MMGRDDGDAMVIVLRALQFSAVVLVAVGIWMTAAGHQALVGVGFIAAGVVDGLMAWGLVSRRDG